MSVDRNVERLRDQILILEYRSGDLSALEKLISRWQTRIYYYIATVLQDRDAAWDVSQDVWLGAITGLGRREPVRNFSAWLYRIAHNKVISHLRKKGRLDKHQEALPETIEELPAEVGDPIGAADDGRLVRECLQGLPLAQREALSLFYLDDLSLGDIAHILDVPQGTVQSRLHYGRTKMKDLLLKKGYSRDQR